MVKQSQHTANGRQIVDWSEPPPSASGVGVYTAIVEKLQASPGQWARLDDRASENAAQAFASSVRNNRVAGFREGRYDARHSGPSVWVRYLGERELDLRTHHR